MVRTSSITSAAQRLGRRAESCDGFTLIELLVAISVMALMAVLSWRGLDAMVRVQAQTHQRADEVLALQIGLAQWKLDLDAMGGAPLLKNLDWDGRVLRLTRRAAQPGDGLRVVAWTHRGGAAGQWLRWQSPVLRTTSAWKESWRRAALWAQNPGAGDHAQEISIAPLQNWHIFYYQNNAWTSPLPAADGQTAAVPDGIRLSMALPPGRAISGTLTLDWVRPTLGGDPS